MRIARISSLIISLGFLMGIGLGVSAQTLITYGGQEISKNEFLKAYRKNNSKSKPTEKSYRQYLELYIRYKLKVRAALDLKFDHLPNQVTELQNFRNQIISNYLNDEPSLNRLINEAFDRSQKDLHLAHIFISASKLAAPADILKSFRKAREAYQALQGGEKFATVAARYSDDPFAKTNGGDLGYVTVFSLPYELETLGYRTPVGRHSPIYRSKAGYHIFQNLGERNALGRVKAAQILLAFPPYANESAKEQARVHADSIYGVLVQGSNFAELAKKFSGDNLSYQTGGEMPEFGVGKYEQGFETVVFSLDKDGEISRPYADAFGYHIVKRLSRRSISTVKNKATLDALRALVMSDPRIEVSRKAMLTKIMRAAHFQQQSVDTSRLWINTESFLAGKSLPPDQALGDTAGLFSFSKKNVTVKDWLDYRKTIRNVQQLVKGVSNRDMYDQFIQNAAFEYYRNHAEDFDPDFAYQLEEFKEGNLLFEIMQRKIWDKASADSSGLNAFYRSHQEKYWWEPSADAILFTCANPEMAQTIRSEMRENPSSWKAIASGSNGSVHADSGRFELSQLPMVNTSDPPSGPFTELVRNNQDNTVTMGYMLTYYRQREPRSFKDARGFVINDYQAYLEDQWIDSLKQKYPVRIDEQVFRTLPR